MVYQTLGTSRVAAALAHPADNIDGKQARRTKSSSALGELFDHGCDSLFVTVRARAVTCTIRSLNRTQIAGVALPAAFGASPWFGFVMLHIGYLAFYYAHWCDSAPLPLLC